MGSFTVAGGVVDGVAIEGALHIIIDGGRGRILCATSRGTVAMWLDVMTLAKHKDGQRLMHYFKRRRVYFPPEAVSRRPPPLSLHL